MINRKFVSDLNKKKNQDKDMINFTLPSKSCIKTVIIFLRSLILVM
jgi:hypothetical protein